MALALSPDDIRFLESGVSRYAGSRDARCVPSVARVLACRAAPDATFQIWLVKSQNVQLWHDSLASDALTVIFSDPATHRTWQFKGSQVKALPVQPQDKALVTGQIDAFSHALEQLGYGHTLFHGMFCHADHDIVSLGFTAQAWYDQTPGPMPAQAGGLNMTRLEDIRLCLEGAVPAAIATCDAEGVPNVSYVSQVHYIDACHVALTFQFFNKTHCNIASNPQVTVYLTHPDTAAQYRVALLYRRTETAGALFASLQAKLAGIASHTGMTDVFRLKGVDIYRVLAIEPVHPGNPAGARPVPHLLPAMRQVAQVINACCDMAQLFDNTLAAVVQQFGITHAMLLLLDEGATALYTVASVGYAASGVGAEVPVGCGVVGVCAQQQVPIRIAFGASEYRYNDAIREHTAQAGHDTLLETSIPFPGLEQPASQLAVPLLAGERLVGVLYVESAEQRRFAYDDEDLMASLGLLFAHRYCLLQGQAGHGEETGFIAASALPEGVPLAVPLAVRYFPANHSIFLNQDYLIKGVAGAIFWRLLQNYQQDGRTEFTNRELRLDASLGLPEISENLESRLVLLQRRLAERNASIRLEKTGRGRFRLRLGQPVRLSVVESC